VVLQRLLLPPLGEKGPAKKVRVCNACLRNSEVSCGLLSAPCALWRRGGGTAVPFVAASSWAGGLLGAYRIHSVAPRAQCFEPPRA
jgi:hypothetical protein